MQSTTTVIPATKDLELLQPFAGTWQTEGEIIATGNAPAIPVTGTDKYEWLHSGYFMLHTVDVTMGEEKINSIEVIGYDEEHKVFTMHYFGYRGTKGIMHAKSYENQWQFYGDSERFTGSFNEDQSIMEGKWEQKKENIWVDWMHIKLTRIN